MTNAEHWLLEPSSRSTVPVTKEFIPVPASAGREEISLTISHPKVPHSPLVHEDLVLYVPGWTEYELGECRDSTAKRGLISASMPHPRDEAIKGLYNFLLSSPSIVRNWGQLSATVWNAHDVNKSENAVMDLLGDFENSGTILRKRLIHDALHAGKRRRENIEEVVTLLAERGYMIHLYGHSLGGIDATMATADNPHLIRSLGLLGTAGLVYDDSVTNIIPRIAKTAAGEGRHVTSSPRAMAKMALRSILFVLENPALTIREGQYAASGRLHGQINKLVIANNIPVINVVGENDSMFPSARVLRDTQDTLFADTVVIPKAGHNFTVYQAGGVAIIAINAALDLRERTSSRLKVQLHNKKENNKRKNSLFYMTDNDIADNLFTRAS